MLAAQHHPKITSNAKESRHASTQHTGGRIGPTDLEIRNKECKKEVEPNNATENNINMLFRILK